MYTGIWLFREFLKDSLDYFINFLENFLPCAIISSHMYINFWRISCPVRLFHTLHLLGNQEYTCVLYCGQPTFCFTKCSECPNQWLETATTGRCQHLKKSCFYDRPFYGKIWKPENTNLLSMVISLFWRSAFFRRKMVKIILFLNFLLFFTIWILIVLIYLL